MIEQILKPEVQKFIKEHENQDPFSLSLRYKEIFDIPVKLIAAQIAARQKAKGKLPEWYDAQGIIFPPLISMEQCSSEATAKYKAELLSDSSLADLTGGAGVDTYYLGKKRTQIYYVEQNHELATITENNLTHLGVDNLQVLKETAEKFLSNLSHNVDNFYIDPARRNENDGKVFRFEDCTPDVITLLPDLLSKCNKKIMIKASPMLDIDLAIKDLKYVTEVHIVAVENECKEVLYLVEKGTKNDIKLVTVNIKKKGEREIFTFTKAEEGAATAPLSTPKNYLYEPNSAILKSGAFNIIALKHNVDKLHQHTHLYTSSTYVDNFPGRTFKVLKVVSYNKKVIAELLPQKKANITVRNFPEDVKTIRKKLGLKDGGDLYLLAFTDVNNEKKIAITQKVL